MAGDGRGATLISILGAAGTGQRSGRRIFCARFDACRRSCSQFPEPSLLSPVVSADAEVVCLMACQRERRVPAHSGLEARIEPGLEISPVRDESPVRRAEGVLEPLADVHRQSLRIKNLALEAQ